MPFACKPDAIAPDQRGRYKALTENLLQAIDETLELTDGYRFRLAGKRISVEDVVEWVKLESQCCPFFGFQLEWEPNAGPLWLRLKGSEGVKDFIRLEFGIPGLR